jgi:hypothetical protein
MRLQRIKRVIDARHQQRVILVMACGHNVIIPLTELARADTMPHVDTPWLCDQCPDLPPEPDDPMEAYRVACGGA